MSIEIKQMIIKSTLISEQKEHQYSELTNVDIEALKDKVMEECRELIGHSLNEIQER